jgi:hypothetical protein
MNQVTGNGSRWTIRRVLRAAAAILLFAGAVIQPEVVAIAAPGNDGGGRFHGGGFHHGFGHPRDVFGSAAIDAPYWWGYGYPYSDYEYYDKYPDHRYYGYDPSCSYYGTCPNYGYGSHPSGRQTWYYCSNPTGYYPYVTQCKTGWLSVPGG